MGIKVTGLGKFIAKFEDLADSAKDDYQLALEDFGNRVVTMAKGLVSSNSSDEGALLRSISAVNGNLSVEVVAATRYAAYIEFGTRKFAAAYVSTLPSEWSTFASTFQGKGGGTFAEFIRSIMEWCRRKGIDEKAAYPIARSILINGIRPRPFIYPSVVAETPLLIDDVKAVIQ